MRAVILLGGLASVVCAVASLSCGSSDTQCTCLVQNNGEHRTLTCGDTACVGGISVNCAGKDQSVQRGACAAPPSSVDPGSTATAPTASAAPDTSCADLSTFCTASCRSPASVSADCQTTASSGDPAACAAWPLSSGVLCSP